MSVLWFAVGILGDCLGGVFKKFHKRDCSIFFAFIACLSIVLLFWITAGFKFEMQSGIWWYAVLYGVFYGISAVFSTTAYKTGDLTLTALFICFSGLLPPLYDVIFFGVKVNLIFWLGLIFFILSMIFINVKFSKKESEKIKRKKARPIWVISLTLAVVFYGAVMIVMGCQQKDFNGKGQNELMIVGGLIASAICLICSVILERGKIKEGIIGTVLLGGSMGVFAGLYNLAYMMLVSLVAVTIIAPTLLVGSLLVSILIGLVAYKEKYQLVQYVGLLFGIVSVVLFNI